MYCNHKGLIKLIYPKTLTHLTSNNWIFVSAYTEFRRKNAQIRLPNQVVILTPGHQAVIYIKPWITYWVAFSETWHNMMEITTNWGCKNGLVKRYRWKLFITLSAAWWCLICEGESCKCWAWEVLGTSELTLPMDCWSWVDCGKIGQYLACWWPGSWCRQIIIRHDVHYGWFKKFLFSLTENFNSLCYVVV